jgi:L-ascorbate metabolism protein UlaG (beta-lactamase superfamily)
MIHDPSSSSWFSALKNGGQQRRSALRRRKKDENHIGLLPTEGWRKRNLQFIGEVLIPSLLSPRRPCEDFGALPEVDEKGIGVTWLGHAGFLVRAAGLNIAIDPNWALWHGPVKRVRHPSLRAADMPPIDLVLVTHAHFDHLHLPSLRKIAAEQPIIVPHGVGSLVKRCGFGRVVELNMWQRAIFRDVQITLTPARHWGARMIHDTHRMFGGYLIQSKERTVFHCGDSALFDGFVEIGKRADIDLALMPIGAYDAPSGRPVHMNPEEAVDAFEMLRAGYMIPMHHDTFPLGGEPIHEPAERLARAAVERQLEDRIRILQEGESAVY